MEDKNPLAGAKDQKPAGGGEPGFSISKPEEKKPTLLDITLEDLRDTERLGKLHAEAVERELITSSEADRLKFFAGAVHAQSVGANPARLFAWMIWKKRWDFITQADEDEAISRLKKAQRRDLPQPTAGQGGGRPTLSQDARLVRELRAILRQKGIHVGSIRGGAEASSGLDSRALGRGGGRSRRAKLGDGTGRRLREARHVADVHEQRVTRRKPRTNTRLPALPRYRGPIHAAKREHSRGSLLGEHFLRHEAGKNVRSTPQGLAEKQQRDVALECERAAS